MAKRYSVLVTVYDHDEEKGICQKELVETNDLEEAAAEFEAAADADFDDCQPDDSDDQEDDDGDEEDDDGE